MKFIFRFTVIILFMILFVQLAIASSNNTLGIGKYNNDTEFQSAYDTDGVYYVTTEDGVKLVIKHYRPFKSDNFNTKKQPIILFNGIVCSMKEFDIRTTAETKNLYAGFKLDPKEIEAWARDDSYVKKDPMLYYSIAYYLWKFGYDVWLTHYRGTGAGTLKSDLDKQGITLDEWIVYDTPAIIDEVYKLTGLQPIIGGHSTGGVVSYGYLQGAYFDKNSGHVKNDIDLSKKRNSFIKAYLGFDQAGEWPYPSWSDLTPIWQVMATPLFVQAGDMIYNSLKAQAANYLINPDSPIYALVQNAMVTLFNLDEATGNDGLFQYTSIMNTKNINKYVLDYFFRYGVTGFPMRGIGMYYDYGINHTIREFWKNGEENKDLIKGPKPTAGDGYYYYKDNMNLVTIPALSMLSETQAIVSPTNMIRDFVKGKTHHLMDETHVIPNTGHMDVVVGDTAPKVLYYILRDWFSRMEKYGYL